MKEVKPIQIQVDYISEYNYLASVIGVNISASGDSKGDAFANLQDIIFGTRKLLQSYSRNQLGPDMIRQLDFLSSHSNILESKGTK